MSKGLYYFAHPYSCMRDGEQIGAGVEANFRICNYRAGELVKRGYNIFSPISQSHPIQKAHPDLAKMCGTEEGKLWYALDNEFIERTDFDGIILAPNWESSTGCVNERKLFRSQGKPVLFYDNIVGKD